MYYFLNIIFALSPSFIWLLFYLRKDKHPESNRMVLKIFFLGIIAAGFAAAIELLLFKITSQFQPSILITAINFFLIIAFVEEFLKFLVVKVFVLNHKELDEPLDIMLYMIISALGFAALENILILSPARGILEISDSLSISFSRFIGATFLHTLISGTLGFFLAISFCDWKNPKKELLIGFSIATALHGLYNFAIMETRGALQLLIPILILSFLAVFTTMAFRKLKKLKGVCKIKK